MPADGPPSRIVFAGTPEFAVPALEAVAALGVAIPVVLTQPDRPAGRGRHLSASPVKKAAERLRLRVEQPQSLADPSLVADRLNSAEPRPDLLVVAAYGLLLPRWMLEWPKYGCINVHASLLPRWRGAAPIQYAIMAGDRSTGVSLMRMEAGLDTGPVYAERAIPIGSRETAGEVHDRLAHLGAALVTDALPDILSGRLKPEAQDHALRTYAPKIDKADARLDWRQPAAALALRVRAFNPWPVAFAELSDGRTMRVFVAEALPTPPESKAATVPGRLVATRRAGIDVMTSEGILRLQRIQMPSSRIMDAEAYLAAHSLEDVTFV